jgi:hypothetical protein
VLGWVIIILTPICTVPAFSWLSAVTSLLMTILSTDSYRERIKILLEVKLTELQSRLLLHHFILSQNVDVRNYIKHCY